MKLKKCNFLKLFIKLINVKIKSINFSVGWSVGKWVIFLSVFRGG